MRDDHSNEKYRTTGPDAILSLNGIGFLFSSRMILTTAVVVPATEVLQVMNHLVHQHTSRHYICLLL